jgi:hypothetical protein
MPKQSRGFWVCTLCSQAFDRFEEASYHENETCPRRFAIHPARDQALWQQRRYQPELYSMPPLASTSSNLTMGYQMESSSPTAFAYDRKLQSHYTAMLQPNEQSNLVESDAIACQYIEIFEDGDASRQENKSRKIGLRCSCCASSSSERFPRNKLDVAESVRKVTEDHLVMCSLLPEPSRSMLKQALRQCQQRSKEKGSALYMEEENRRKLIDFCNARCEQAGVIDAEPKNSGISFGTQPSTSTDLSSRMLKPSEQRQMTPSSQLTRRSPPNIRRKIVSFSVCAPI